MRKRRPVLATATAAAALLLGAAGAQAGGVVSADGSGTRVANLLYSLDADSPTEGNPCDPEGVRPFETATLTVSADGDYAFRDPRSFGNDSLAFVRDTSEGAEQECREADDDDTLSLQDGVEYELLLTRFDSGSDFPGGEFGTYGFVVTGASGTTGSVSVDGMVDGDSPELVGGHEVTGNGSNLATIDYTLDAGSPTATDFRQDSAEPCDDEGTLPGETAYETVRMQVSQDGDYRFRSADTLGDGDVYGFAAVHEGEVNAPDGPGCIETTDRSEGVELQAGTTYTLFLAGLDDRGIDPASTLGRFVFSVTPNDEFDGLVTFSSAEPEVIDESVVCAKDGPVPAGYGEAIEGSSRGETLVGTPGNDVIRGLGGNDVIRGMGGDDILCGGAGNDSLVGGDGEDVLFGEAGNDDLAGGAGDDVLVGGPGNDLLNGGAGTDVGFDLAGNNTFRLIESRVLPDNVVAR